MAKYPKLQKYFLIFITAVLMFILCSCENTKTKRGELSTDLESTGTIQAEYSTDSVVSEGETIISEMRQGETAMTEYDFSIYTNAEITGIDLSSLEEEELAVLNQQARYCQAMTDADIDTMREIVSEDMIFTHLSGRQQTREEYFADVADGSLDYYTIGIANPVIEVDGDTATITYTSVLNANAYGARGTFRMGGTHRYEKRNGVWTQVNR